eukprot:SAG31_NODE_3852_length_3817_cov_6.007800_5_plen_403_part_00
MPEYMVQKINELSRGNMSWQGQDKGGFGQINDAKRRWKRLGARLHVLIDLKRQWGDLHDIYETSAESLFEGVAVPRGLRDPESTFSSIWDLVSVVFLLYVAAAVPLRTAFDLDVELGSFWFFFDAIIDIFFICDLFLNFRTAYYTKAGLLEDRLPRIAKNYLRGWFTVDFLSCLPLSYLVYIAEDEGCEKGSGSSYRAIKALRLIRLSKMLRLARIKKLLSKWGTDINFQQWIDIIFTIFLILFMVHILGCVFYAIGKNQETLATGVEVNGWVLGYQIGEGLSDGVRWCARNGSGSGSGSGSDGSDGSVCDIHSECDDVLVGHGVRYTSALYHAMNALESGSTFVERSFAIIATFTNDFILGLVASVITAIQIQSGGGDAESTQKLVREEQTTDGLGCTTEL